LPKLTFIAAFTLFAAIAKQILCFGKWKFEAIDHDEGEKFVLVAILAKKQFVMTV
jgi:hypothetical protein